MTTTQAILTILICAFGTLVTRALPFFAFPAHKPTPTFIVYLGKVLPFAITAMLIVYCLKDVSVTSFPFGAPECIAVLAVSAIYLLVKNSLLAIAVGTILYMLLVQLVFL